MCPLCVTTVATTVALISGGVASTGGVAAPVESRRRSRNKKNKEKAMSSETKSSQLPKNTPPVVSPKEWEAAWERLLVKEKALTRARDAMAAERRRMPWVAVEKKYAFEGPRGKASL